MSDRDLSRRRLFGLAGMAGAGAVLAACGGPSTTTTSSSSSSSGGAVAGSGSGSAAVSTGPNFAGVKPASKITFWSSNPGSSQQVTQQIINAFTAQTKISVELVTAGATYADIAQKFQTALAGGGVPDVIVLSDVWWFRYYLQNNIIPLNSAMSQAGINAADYVDTFFADYTYKNAQWAIPWARSTPLFYYNKAHWAAAKLPDRAPQTWDEFTEWAPKLAAAGTGAQHVFTYTAPANTPGWVDQNVLWGQGTAFSTKDSFDLTIASDANVAAFQGMQDHVYKDKWAVMSGNSETNDFSAGATSATWGSTGASIGVQKAAKFSVGVGPLPGGPKVTTPVCPTGGAGLGIPSKAPVENQLAAAQFIAFLTNSENAITFDAATGYLPVRKGVDTSALKAKNPLVQPALDQVANTRSQDWARVFVPGADSAMTTSIQKIMSQQADVKSTLTALQTQVQGFFDDQVKPHI